MKAADRKDLESLTNYIFQHEFEDYIDCLCETFPEDVDYILECQREGNVDSLDKYAWNGAKEVPHIYAVAARIYKNMLC